MHPQWSQIVPKGMTLPTVLQDVPGVSDHKTLNYIKTTKLLSSHLDRLSVSFPRNFDRSSLLDSPRSPTSSYNAYQCLRAVNVISPTEFEINTLPILQEGLTTPNPTSFSAHPAFAGVSVLFCQLCLCSKNEMAVQQSGRRAVLGQMQRGKYRPAQRSIADF